MSSSRKEDVVFAVYSDSRSVFTLTDIAMLTGIDSYISLSKRLDYYVKREKLLRPRKGIYAKNNYKPEELACSLYTPSYISLEYVLQKAGVVFQYDERITTVSYLSRSIEIEGQTYAYRKIKGEILVATDGIIRNSNINIATPERAFLDILYLDKEYYFDNLNPLNKELINKLLPIYNSKTLTTRVKKLLQNG